MQELRVLSVMVLMGLPLSAALPACTIVRSDSHVSHTGNVVPPDAYSGVSRGDSEAYVEATLGGPTSRTELDEGRSIWRWDSTIRRRGSGSVLLLFHSHNSSEKRQSVYVQFKDGVVEKKWKS